MGRMYTRIPLILSARFQNSPIRASLWRLEPITFFDLKNVRTELMGSECTVIEPSYFKLCTEHCPIHLALLDEVVTCHNLLHPKVLNLLIQLFESKRDELEILVQLEMKKMMIDRIAKLLSKECIVPVVSYIKQCWQRGDTDISLIRYFVTEVLEAIEPPYSAKFVQLFLPMVENEEITGTMKGDGDNV